MNTLFDLFKCRNFKVCRALYAQSNIKIFYYTTFSSRFFNGIISQIDSIIDWNAAFFYCKLQLYVGRIKI